MFDYNTLPPETTDLLRTNASRIRGLVKLTKDAMFEIGRLLLECKALIPHGQFLPWIEAEFTERLGWSLSTAENWMALAENRNVYEFPLSASALYQLAGAPDDAIETIQQMIDNGEPVTVKQVAATVIESRFRAKITESVTALQNAKLTENRSRAALELLRELEQSIKDSRYRNTAIELLKAHGDQLRAWGQIQDTKEEIMAQAGVSWEERREPEPLGTVRAELQEGEANHQLVIWLPGEIAKPIIIATFPDVDDPVAIAWQCSVVDVACRRVNASKQLDKYVEL